MDDVCYVIGAAIPVRRRDGQEVALAHFWRRSPHSPPHHVQAN